MLHERVSLAGVDAHGGVGHDAAVRRHLLLIKGGHWMSDLARIETIRHWLSRQSRLLLLLVGRGWLGRAELFLAQDQVVHVGRVVARALRLLHGDVARVRTQQSVRLLALLDLLVLHNKQPRTSEFATLATSTRLI